MTDYRKRATTFYIRTGLLQLAIALCGYLATGNLAFCFVAAAVLGLACLAVQVFIDTNKAIDRAAQ